MLPIPIGVGGGEDKGVCGEYRWGADVAGDAGFEPFGIWFTSIKPLVLEFLEGVLLAESGSIISLIVLLCDFFEESGLGGSLPFPSEGPA